MKLTLLHGYPDNVGQRQIFDGYGSGPASYVQLASGGDVVSAPNFQFYFDNIFPAMSKSGTYLVYAFPTVMGARATWALKWVTASTGAEVSAAVDLSAEQVMLSGFGGNY